MKALILTAVMSLGLASVAQGKIKEVRKAKATFYVSISQMVPSPEGGFDEVSQPVCEREGKISIWDNRGQGDEFITPEMEQIEPCQFTDANGVTHTIHPQSYGVIMAQDGESKGFNLNIEALVYVNALAIVSSSNLKTADFAHEYIHDFMISGDLTRNKLWAVLEPESITYKDCMDGAKSCDTGKFFFSAVVKVEDDQN